MENHDMVGERAIYAAAASSEGHVSIDRFEMTRKVVEQEEEQAMAGAALYEKAARAWMQSDVPEIPEPADSEELEAISQELKLRQKCQDIAALILADEQDLLDSGSDEDEEE